MSQNDEFPEPQRSLRDILDFIHDQRDQWLDLRSTIDTSFESYEENPDAADLYNVLTAKINAAGKIRDFVFTKLREATYKGENSGSNT